METHSKTGSLSAFDILSWAKQTGLTVVALLSVKVLDILPEIQNLSIDFLTEKAGDSDTVAMLAMLAVNSLVQLIRKFLTDYTK